MDYQIINKSNVSIIAIQGDITRHDKQCLEKCFQEICRLQSTLMILLFKNVSVVEPGAFRDLTLIQHETRKRNAELRIVGLNSSVKNTLSSGGVIRLCEIKNSLDEALSA